LGFLRSSWFARNAFARFHVPKLRDRTQRGNKVGIGFDFGTSNSAVAVFDGQRVTVVSLEDSALVMPSATYVDKAFRAEVGQRAILEYIEGNRGRRVEFRAEVLGEARVSTGQHDERSGLPTTAETFTLYGKEVDDFGSPGRLFYGIKRLLADEDNERIAVFGKPTRLVALMTPILEKMRRTLENTLRNEGRSLEDAIARASVTRSNLRAAASEAMRSRSPESAKPIAMQASFDRVSARSPSPPPSDT
jgi:hypothetical protein